MNARFADAVVEHHRPGDLVWVHDYQLMLRAGARCARASPRRASASSSTSPSPPRRSSASFPSGSRSSRACSGRTSSASTPLPTSATSRRRCCGPPARGPRWTASPGAGARCGSASSRWAWTRRASRELAGDPAVVEEMRRLRAGSERLLVGIDRLDYTKGIPRRLLAYEQLLLRHPELREHVRMVQVAVPSRTGRGGVPGRARDGGRAGGAHQRRVRDADLVPGALPLPRPLARARSTALYRAADVLLVTPIRDGMNLVAKEFIAARSDGDGVLVLSEFAGAAAELAEALLVNPYDVEGTADALWRALQMPSRGAAHPDARPARTGGDATTCTGGRASSSTAWARTSNRRTRSAPRRRPRSPRPRRGSGRRPPRRCSSTTTGHWWSSRARRTSRCPMARCSPCSRPSQDAT